MINLIGQKFGRLVIVRKTDSRDRDGSIIWECICECKNTIYTSANRLRFNKTKSCGCYHKEKITGKNNSNYRHDLSDEERKLSKERHYLPETKIWANTIKYLDNHTCRKCGRNRGKLNSHHIYNWLDYPNLRLNLDNGITLCDKCHKRFHKIYGKRNTTQDQLNEFLQNV